MCCSRFDLQSRQLFRNSAKWLCEMRSSKFSCRVLGSAFTVLSELPAPGVWDLAGARRKEGRLRQRFPVLPRVPMFTAARALRWLLPGSQTGPCNQGKNDGCISH